MTSVPIPVINKENNKLIPSTYKPKLILREGTQFTTFIIVCPELVIGNSERKYKNKAKGKIKTNKTIKKYARTNLCKKDKYNPHFYKALLLIILFVSNVLLFA